MRARAADSSKAVERKPGERGSALLIVFAFAAMIAIMLYMELPVVAFEAQREKEQLLIDRGDEYAHAVKLFVRKLGTYPASIEALEKTNQMRFLRHRFKDPLTGKDDWRILHAGPNGVLVDSKVNPLGSGKNGGQNGAGANAGAQNNLPVGGFGGFGNNGTASTGNSFGSSSFGNNASSSSGNSPEVVVPTVHQRPPAVAANGSGHAAAGSTGEENPLMPLLPPGQTDTNAGNGATNPDNAGIAGAPGSLAPGSLAPGLTAPGLTAPGATAPGSPAPGNAQAGNDAAPGNGAAEANPNAAVSAGASTPGTGTTGSVMGRISSGGIAGVASQAAGHSIKTVNDQTDYSLWEFYYDPMKDANRRLANMMGAAGAAPQNTGQSGGFGQSPQNGFGTGAFGAGNSSSPGNSFGTNGGPSNAPPAAAPGGTATPGMPQTAPMEK